MKKPVNLCVPVLRRYDLLRGMITSAFAGFLKPENVWIINNGRDANQLMQAIGDLDISAKVHTPKEKGYGVAKSWNWFIDNVPEERIITNDDIVFAPNSIAALVAAPEDLVWGSGFSCFLLRDACVGKLGKFDETISPDYGYYEDDDYLQRLDGRGSRARNATAENVDCGIVHLHSQTLQGASHEELIAHHSKFKLAQRNYCFKWGLCLDCFQGGIANTACRQHAAVLTR